KSIKILSGPELLNSYVGKSEENTRMLFAEAETDQKNNSDNLHVIIFDEAESLFKIRGSSNSSAGVSDNVVTTILAKIDGVDVLNNILLILLTNRKDQIDPAILRPGRIEIHIEIGLPDEK